MLTLLEAPGFATVAAVDRAAERLGSVDRVHTSGRLAWSLSVSPGVIRVRRRCLDPGPAREQRGRGPITVFSPASRRNMLTTFGSLDWSPLLDAPRLPVMVTLTLPGDWRSVCPDGATFKRWLAMFRRRWERRWGPPRGVWTIEFQRRGAIHAHLYLARPDVPFSVLTEWVSRAWYEVVGSGDERHLRAGTGVDSQWCARYRSPRRLVSCFSRHNGKAAQKRVPPEWQEPGRGPGRWWGVWNLERIEREVPLTIAEVIELRRVVRRMYEGRSTRRLRSLRGRELAGFFVMVEDGAQVAEALARWWRPRDGA